MVGVPPCADLQPSANPAKPLRGIDAGLISAHDALRRPDRPFDADRLTSALDNLGGDDGFGFHWRSAFHPVFHYTALAALHNAVVHYAVFTASMPRRRKNITAALSCATIPKTTRAVRDREYSNPITRLPRNHITP